MPIHLPKLDADGRLAKGSARGSLSRAADRPHTDTTFTCGAGRIQAGLTTIAADGLYTKMRIFGVDNSALTFTDVRMAVYLVDGNTYNLVAETSNVSAQVPLGPVVEGNLVTPVSLEAGDLVYLAILSQDAIVLPAVQGANAAWKVLPPAVSLYDNGHSSLPATLSSSTPITGYLVPVELLP